MEHNILGNQNSLAIDGDWASIFGDILVLPVHQRAGEENMMKNKGIFVAVAFLLIMANVIALANAEITVNGLRAVIGQNETRNSMTITIDDTSPDGILKSFDNNISIYATHNINYTIPSGETIVLCLYNAQQIKNEYDSLGNLINSTVIIDTAVYNYSATSIKYYALKDKDTLKVDLNCFWDRDINDTLFQYLSPAIMGLGANSFSFACGECARQDYEEVLNDYVEAKAQTGTYLQAFDNMMSFSLNDVEIWYMLYWIIRIALLIILVMLTFMAGIWLYHFFRSIANEI